MKLNLSHGMKGALFSGVVLLAGTGVMGCGEKEDTINIASLLEGTILEDTYVITDSNSDVYIVRKNIMVWIFLLFRMVMLVIMLIFCLAIVIMKIL